MGQSIALEDTGEHAGQGMGGAEQVMPCLLLTRLWVMLQFRAFGTLQTLLAPPLAHLTHQDPGGWARNTQLPAGADPAALPKH